MRFALCALAALSLSGVEPHVTAVEKVERFYASGQLQSREYFLNGHKTRRHETFWPNGRHRSVANYADNVFQGEYRTWRENGHPYELRHFDRGREAGLQQSWTDEGELFLNYEVRHGRRYGFINAAPCLPTDEQGVSKEVGR